MYTFAGWQHYVTRVRSQPVFQISRVLLVSVYRKSIGDTLKLPKKKV
jgi:hypothetical protein